MKYSVTTTGANGGKTDCQATTKTASCTKTCASPPPAPPAGSGAFRTSGTVGSLLLLLLAAWL